LRCTVGVLIIFAIVASAAVLHKGLQDENRNKFRLALHCIMILTSVVPPELPMELSLAGEREEGG
jgi:manganese-transporting P-type ATPase